MNTKISRTLATIVLGLAWMESALAISIVGTAVNPANGHTYHLLSADNGSGVTWADAETYAVSLGGHLATINDSAENDWVFNTFADYGGVSRTLWTGYRRSVNGGPFSWTSGETPGFENWYPGEPNNFTGSENFTAFVPTAQGLNTTKWFDMFESTTYLNTQIHGVVELSTASVPDGGATFGLFGLALAGLALLRRKASPA